VHKPWTSPDLAEQYPATMLYQENSSWNPAREPLLRERLTFFSKESVDHRDPLSPACKTYPLCPCLHLPHPLFRSPIERVIEKRRTRRKFTGKGISTRQLARILISAYGITTKEGTEAGAHLLRACPSAGALYPLEIYPVILHSKDLQAGLYHYNIDNHGIELLAKGALRDKIEANLLGVELMPGADVALLVTSILERTLAKYGERGYRFILIEIGHLAQNVSLVCEAMKLNAVCIGGFYEDGLADLLSTDRRGEPVQHVILLGTR